MFFALSWFFVASLLALWSLAAWALHALAHWTVSSAGAFSGAGSAIGSIPWPAWLSPWLPPEFTQWLGQVLRAAGPVLDGLLQATPALASGVSVVAWVVWGIGSVLLLLLGAGLHLLIALGRRHGGGGARPGAPLATG